jgi:hypothetical protein
MITGSQEPFSKQATVKEVLTKMDEDDKLGP